MSTANFQSPTSRLEDILFKPCTARVKIAVSNRLLKRSKCPSKKPSRSILISKRLRPLTDKVPVGPVVPWSVVLSSSFPFASRHRAACLHGARNYRYSRTSERRQIRVVQSHCRTPHCHRS